MEKPWEEIGFPKDSNRPKAVPARGFQEFRELASDNSVRLMIASYKTLKRFGLDDWAGIRASLGKWLFKPCHRPGTRLDRERLSDPLSGIGIDLRVRPIKLTVRIQHKRLETSGKITLIGKIGAGRTMKLLRIL